MKTLDIIILIVILIIVLSLIDRIWFRKIIISEITKIDSERNLINTKVVMFFGIIKSKSEFIEMDGKYYMKFGEGNVSTDEVEPRFIKKALLKYRLEK